MNAHRCHGYWCHQVITSYDIGWKWDDIFVFPETYNFNYLWCFRFQKWCNNLQMHVCSSGNSPYHVFSIKTKYVNHSKITWYQILLFLGRFIQGLVWVDSLWPGDAIWTPMNFFIFYLNKYTNICYGNVLENVIWLVDKMETILFLPQCVNPRNLHINLLWPSEVIWRHRSGSTTKRWLG